MRASHDTFLHLLADNLDPSIPVHAVRRDPSDPAADDLQMNAVNVNFMTMDFDIHIGIIQVSIDVLNDDQLAAMDVTKAVWNILSAAFFTRKFDYSSGSPVAVQPATNLYWKTAIKFRPVKNSYYYHYTCLLTIHHHPV